MQRLIAGCAALALAAIASHAVAAPFDPIGDLLQKIQDVGQTAISAPVRLMRATLYHSGHGVGVRDSMGCRAVPMRTLAVDPHIVPKGTVVFIKETVGLAMPDGELHDGLWYASDVGGAIKGERIDLYTGAGQSSMRTLMPLNLKSLSVSTVRTFDGCPPVT